MFRHYFIISAGVVLAAIAIAWGWHMHTRHDAPSTSPYVNSVLAIRGFRHADLEVATGESADYAVGVGEEFKVTWKIENATEDGQILYHGPAGIGGGLGPVARDAPASPSAAPVLTLKALKAGTAQFLLTVTGPGPDGIYTLTSTLTVHIK